MNPLLYFWLFFKASLLSTGGMGNLPSLHADLISRRWAVERQFVEALAIGQVSPGPNGLWVICLGYLTNGLPGALMAMVAICLPPMLVLIVEKVYRRIQHHPAVEGFVRGIMLAVVGTFSIVLLSFLRDVGIDSRSISIGAVAALLIASKRISLLVIILLAAIAGICLYR